MAAFAVGGLAASIPAFVGGPGPEPSHSASYRWTRQLPLVPAGYRSFTAEARPIATSPDGGKLLAVRQVTPGGDSVCVEYRAFREEHSRRTPRVVALDRDGSVRSDTLQLVAVRIEGDERGDRMRLVFPNDEAVPGLDVGRSLRAA
ncbi:MAG: hypothetical protein H0W87_01725 [Actinobacteria bacterium]|nr:hypothetical protein [Actinomycetota bacterium]